MDESKVDLQSQEDVNSGGVPPSGDAPPQTSAINNGLENESHADTGFVSTPGDSPQITDLKNRQLDDFLLLRRIGHGGMAEVYLAEQISLKRKVAVKVLREEMLTDDVHLRRFEQEAKAAGGLNHPNIVQVYSIGEADGVHYIAQEYVQGMNLREFLQRNGPPDVKTALKLMQQIASALEVAGEAGIVHRDIKPENILITRKNTVKVTDFGLAQLSISGERLNLTQVGMTMGTPLYMSPEQVNGRNVDHRSDIYSFGVTSYHLLCGSTPFRGETAISVAIQHVNKEPPALKQQRRDLPDIVCQLVHKTMMKDPDERYLNAEMLLHDLVGIATTMRENPAGLARMRLSEGPQAMQPWAWWLTPFFGWSWRRQAVVFSSLILLSAATAAAVGWWTRPKSPFETTPPEQVDKVPVAATAMEQSFIAMERVDDEAAWRAVLDNFKAPKDRYYRRWAKEELALLFLRTERYDEAVEIYKGFTVEDDKDLSLIATGYAGLAVVASLKEEYLESQRVIQNNLAPLLRDRNSSIPKQLQELLRKAFERNQEQLGKKSQGQLEELFGPTSSKDDD